MLRANARQDLMDILDKSYFGAGNFLVKFADGDPIIFDVSFIPDRRFRFVMQKAPAVQSQKYMSGEAPGERFLLPEVFHFNDLSIAFGRLERWLDRVREELISANPFAREVSDLRKQIEEKIASMDQDMEGFFTAAEASQMTARLDELAARVDELRGRNDQLEVDVSELQGVVADLKSATAMVNKGTWYRMASGRLLAGLKALATSKEAREFALEAAKKFLLEGPK